MSRLIAVFLLTLLSAQMHAQTSAPVDANYWKSQLAKAAAMRRDAEAERREAERVRRVDDAACQHQFLVNACLDKSRDRYLVRINNVRVVEIEASSIERDAKTGEMLYRDKQRAATSRPIMPIVVPESLAAPKTKGALPPVSSAPPVPPKPTMKAINPAQQAAAEHKKQTARTLAAQQAAERAQKAAQDKLRYAARAKVAAEKKAKHAQSAPQAVNGTAVASPMLTK
jgi:hypothetical protein